MLTSISDAVIVQDSAGQVLWQNGSAEDLLKRIKPHREASDQGRFGTSLGRRT